MVIVYRMSKGGSFRVIVDGMPTGKCYMSREQAQRAGVKASGADPRNTAHVPDPLERYRVFTVADALAYVAATI